MSRSFLTDSASDSTFSNPERERNDPFCDPPEIMPDFSITSPSRLTIRTRPTPAFLAFCTLSKSSVSEKTYAIASL